MKSKSVLSELVFWLVRDFRHPLVDKVQDLAMGFHGIPSRLGGMALDYIRGNLMEFRAGSILPHDQPSGQNDILLNRSPKPMALQGWSLLNSSDTAYEITEAMTLAPSEVRIIEMKGVPLSNKGGVISLLDAQGIKVDGVSYTQDQARADIKSV